MEDDLAIKVTHGQSKEASTPETFNYSGGELMTNEEEERRNRQKASSMIFNYPTLKSDLCYLL